MKIVALIPFWDNYQHENPALNGLEVMRLAGRPLINYPIELAGQEKRISDTYIYSSNQNIIELIDRRLSFKYLERAASLDSQTISIETIIASFFKQVEADVVVLLHAKSPFLKVNSLSDFLDKVLNHGYDSAFLARIEKKFAWFSGVRINYEANSGTPHLSAIQPIILETSTLYVFTKDCFNECQTRIGNNPYIRAVDSFEGLVISNNRDMKLAEFLLDAQFH